MKKLIFKLTRRIWEPRIKRAIFACAKKVIISEGQAHEVLLYLGILTPVNIANFALKMLGGATGLKAKFDTLEEK